MALKKLGESKGNGAADEHEAIAVAMRLRLEGKKETS